MEDGTYKAGIPEWIGLYIMTNSFLEKSQKVKSASWFDSFDNQEWLSNLYSIADDAHHQGRPGGDVACIIITHQLLEEILRLLLERSEFLMQVRLFPIEYKNDVPTNKPFGVILSIVEQTIDFQHIREILSLARRMNRIRNKVAHQLTELHDQDTFREYAEQTRNNFEKILVTFSRLLDGFMNNQKTV